MIRRRYFLLSFILMNAFICRNISFCEQVKSEKKVLKTQKTDSVSTSSLISKDYNSKQIFRERTIYIISEYHRFLDKIIKEEKKEPGLDGVNEAEGLLKSLAELCFKDSKTIKVGREDFNALDYASKVNKIILARLNGKYTSADRALRVAESFEDKIQKEVVFIKKKIEDPTFLDPEEKKQMAKDISAAIDDENFILRRLKGEVSFQEQALNNILKEHKILLLQIKKVLSVLNNTKTLADIENELKKNPIVLDEKTEEDALKELKSLTKDSAEREQSFLYAALVELEDSINNQRSNLEQIKLKISEIEKNVCNLNEKIKSPKRELNPDEKEKFVNKQKELLVEKEKSLARQKEIIPSLTKNLEMKKKELESELNKLPPEMIATVNEQIQNVDGIFKKYLDWRQKIELLEKKNLFKQAFLKESESPQKKNIPDNINEKK